MADLDVVPGCVWFCGHASDHKRCLIVNQRFYVFVVLVNTACENSFEIGARLVEVDLFRVSGCYSLFNKRNEVFLVLEFGAPMITEQLV